MIRSSLKWLASQVLDEYRINWIVASTASAAALCGDVVPMTDALCALLESSSSEQMRKAATYHRDAMSGLALTLAGRPVCVAHFAKGAEYDRHGTWPLRDDEAALMDITTEPSEWGKGHAVRLIRAASAQYQAAGTTRLIAFIWWSNRPSLRAFEKAGWKRIGLSLEFNRGGHWRALQVPLPGSNRRS